MGKNRMDDLPEFMKCGDIIDDPEELARISSMNKNSFSHAAVVMRAYVKVQDALATDMKAGFWDTKIDSRGNEINVYLEDTRKKAIETIKTLKNTLVSDLHKSEQLKVIEKKLEELEEKLEEIIKKQKAWFDRLSNNDKAYNREYIPYIMLNSLNEKGIFYQEFMCYAIEIYREIFEQLELCISKNRYFAPKFMSA